jgi:hypothetical protein
MGLSGDAMNSLVHRTKTIELHSHFVVVKWLLSTYTYLCINNFRFNITKSPMASPSKNSIKIMFFGSLWKATSYCIKG